MKRSILSIGIIFLFILSAVSPISFGYNIKINEQLLDNKNIINTHTVLGEFGTASSGSYCPISHSALKELYEEGELDFYYITHVLDKNSISWSYLNYYYNIFGIPTVWWDGGYIVNLGANYAKDEYNISINQCLSRPVYDIDIILSLDWLDVTKMKINCTILNNEKSTYEGTIKVTICEKESSMGWKDYQNVTYTMPFLDWAFNENISILSDDYWNDVTVWDGTSNGFPSITGINTIVIAAVYNNEWHQGYSGIPPDYPFDAYYLDECVAVDFGTNQPPDAPTIDGPASGKPGTYYKYTFTSALDPDGDDVSYYIEWGDSSTSGWTNFIPSGPPGYYESHSWPSKGNYTIRAKVKDIYGAESNWSEFIVTMPRDKTISTSPLLRFLERYPLLNLLLQRLTRL